MNRMEAASTLVKIKGLFPRAEWTDEIEALWLRKIENCGYAMGQVVWAAGEHRASHRFNDPNLRTVMTLLQSCPERAGRPVSDPKAEQLAAEEAFDRKRAATKAWIDQASPEELAAVKERAALHHERTGCPAYADKIRNPSGDDPAILGGAVTAAIEAQLDRDRESGLTAQKQGSPTRGRRMAPAGDRGSEV